MPKSIEILENTLLKLIIRQGTNSERNAITLKSGELGYTTDTKKLYVGDGSTLGGVLVGGGSGGFAGSVVDITTLAPASIGDLAYDSDNNKLYTLKVNTGTSIGDWEQVGGVYSSGDSSIIMSPDNKITVGVLSGDNISPNALAIPLLLDSGKISLSSSIAVNSISPKTGDTLKIPYKFNILNNVYEFKNTSPPVPESVLTILNGSLDVGFAPLTASIISLNALAPPLQLDGTNKLTLSSSIEVDSIASKTGDTLVFPNKINVLGSTYEYISSATLSAGDALTVTSLSPLEVGFTPTPVSTPLSSAGLEYYVSHTVSQPLTSEGKRIARDNINSPFRAIGRSYVDGPTYTIQLSSIATNIMCNESVSAVNFTGEKKPGNILSLVTTLSTITLSSVSNSSIQYPKTYAQYECNALSAWNLIHEIPLSF